MTFNKINFKNYLIMKYRKKVYYIVLYTYNIYFNKNKNLVQIKIKII